MAGLVPKLPSQLYEADELSDADLSVVQQASGVPPVKKVTLARLKTFFGGSSFDGKFTSLTDTPTTIGGYGIADAYTKTAVDSLLGACAKVSALADYSTSAQIAAAYQPLSQRLTTLSATAMTDFGLSFLSIASAADGRSLLALGTAALVATTDFATPAQGALADSAVQPAALSSALAEYVTTAAFSTTLTEYARISAVAAAYQPLDSDLTALAALTTTAYGRNLMTMDSATSAQTALGLGTAALAATGDFATAAQGALAVSAVQPSALATILGSYVLSGDLSTTLSVYVSTTALASSLSGYALKSDVTSELASYTTASDLTTALSEKQDASSELTALAAIAGFTFGRSVLSWSSASSGRTALGLGSSATLDAGSAGGVVPLDSMGKISTAYLPDSVLGNVEYKGTWDAAANSPAIPSASSSNKGWYYIASTSGTLGSLTFEVGDWIVSDGSAWEKVDNTDALSSFNGRTGAIVPVVGDYSAFYQPIATTLTKFAALASATGWLHNDGSGTLSYTTPSASSVGAEAALGNPAADGYVLSSTASGVRSWVQAGTGSGTLTSVVAGTGLSGGTITASGTIAVTGLLSTFYSLTSAAGWLYNDGTGTLSYSSPTKATLGLSAVENTALSTWVGSTKLTMLGTITSGTWNGTAVADAYVAAALTGKTYNGLNLTAAATGFSISGGTTVKTLTISGNSELNQILTTASSPTFVGLTLAGNLTANSGTINGLTIYSGASAFTLSGSTANYTLTVAGNCTVNQHVGTANSPTFAGLTLSGLSTGVVTNTNGVLSSTTALSAALGGTGLSSYTSGDLLYASSATALAKFSPGSTSGNLRWSGSAWVLDTSTYLSSATLAIWVGTSNVTTLGTVTTGIWRGTAISDAYISSASTWSAKQTAYTILSTLGLLSSSAGWLYNNGAGTLSYSSPTAATVGLGSVENTALSTWSGSSNITTLGTIASAFRCSSTLAGTGLFTNESSIPEAASTYGSTKIYMCTSAGVNSGQYIRLHWNGNSNKLYVSANGSTTLYVMN